MNKIIITDKEWEKISTFLDGHYIVPHSEFCFSEFEFVFSWQVYKVYVRDGTYDFGVTLRSFDDRVGLIFSYEQHKDAWKQEVRFYDAMPDTDFVKTVEKYLTKELSNKRTQGENIFLLILGTMEYIIHCPRNHKIAYPIPRKYSREHRISTSQNKVYLLDDIVKYVHDNYVPQGGTHNIQCECWGVRGHYRTYKSGKQVWINAYKKGKKRNEMEPKDKTYYLSKGVTI